MLLPTPKLGKDAPNKLLLFHWGLNKTTKGPVYLTVAGAKEIIRRFNEQKTLIPIFIDHRQEEDDASDKDLQASGHGYQFETDTQGLWLSVQFNADREEEIRMGRWLYYSSGFLHAKKVVKNVYEVSLTNRPAAYGLRPLMLSQGAPTMDETLITQIRPLKEMLSAAGDCMKAAQMAMESSNQSAKDVAQKLTALLPDVLEMMNKMIQEIDPEGKTSEMIDELAKEKTPAPIVEQPKKEAPPHTEGKQEDSEHLSANLFELCKQITGKSDVEEIHGELLAMKRFRHVAVEQLTLSRKSEQEALVEKAVAQGVISPVEKEEYMKLSVKALKTFLDGTKSLFSDELTQKNERIETLSQKNAPQEDFPDYVKESMKRIKEKLSNKEG